MSCLSSAALAAAPTTLGFANDSELGIVLTGGNSRSESLNLKQEDTYTWTNDKVKGAYRYLYNKANGVESAKNWAGELRYERSLSAAFAAYLGQGIEGDPYAGYDRRFNSDIGGKYNVIKTEDFVWDAELGYRYTSEERVTPPNVYSHFGRLYTELNKNWTPTASTKLWLEYLPNFSHPKGYLINTELSATTVFTSIFSIKLAYLLKYDNDPGAGISQKADSFFTTALVAKF